MEQFRLKVAERIISCLLSSHGNHILLRDTKRFNMY